MRVRELRLTTGDRLVTNLTHELGQFVADSEDGLLNVFVPHATAGLAIIEVGSGSDDDLAIALERLAPRDAPWHHRHGSTGHGRDHVIPAFVAPSLTIPVLGGALALGTWQSVVLVDPNVDNPVRRVLLSLLEEPASSTD